MELLHFYRNTTWYIRNVLTFSFPFCWASHWDIHGIGEERQPITVSPIIYILASFPTSQSLPQHPFPGAMALEKTITEIPYRGRLEKSIRFLVCGSLEVIRVLVVAPACKWKLFGCTERKGRGTMGESEGGTKKTGDVFSPAVFNFLAWTFLVGHFLSTSSQI